MVDAPIVFDFAELAGEEVEAAAKRGRSPASPVSRAGRREIEYFHDFAVNWPRVWFASAGNTIQMKTTFALASALLTASVSAVAFEPNGTVFIPH
jgi:hypothetical protein